MPIEVQYSPNPGLMAQVAYNAARGQEQHRRALINEDVRQRRQRIAMQQQSQQNQQRQQAFANQFRTQQEIADNQARARNQAMQHQQMEFNRNLRLAKEAGVDPRFINPALAGVDREQAGQGGIDQRFVNPALAGADRDQAGVNLDRIRRFAAGMQQPRQMDPRLERRKRNRERIQGRIDQARMEAGQIPETSEFFDDEGLSPFGGFMGGEGDPGLPFYEGDAPVNSRMLDEKAVGIRNSLLSEEYSPAAKPIIDNLVGSYKAMKEKWGEFSEDQKKQVLGSFLDRYEESGVEDLKQPPPPTIQEQYEKDVFKDDDFIYSRKADGTLDVTQIKKEKETPEAPKTMKDYSSFEDWRSGDFDNYETRWTNMRKEMVDDSIKKSAEGNATIPSDDEVDRKMKERYGRIHGWESSPAESGGLVGPNWAAGDQGPPSGWKKTPESYRADENERERFSLETEGMVPVGSKFKTKEEEVDIESYIGKVIKTPNGEGFFVEEGEDDGFVLRNASIGWERGAMYYVTKAQMEKYVKKLENPSKHIGKTFLDTKTGRQITFDHHSPERPWKLRSSEVDPETGITDSVSEKSVTRYLKSGRYEEVGSESPEVEPQNAEMVEDWSQVQEGGKATPELEPQEQAQMDRDFEMDIEQSNRYDIIKKMSTERHDDPNLSDIEKSMQMPPEEFDEMYKSSPVFRDYVDRAMKSLGNIRKYPKESVVTEEQKTDFLNDKINEGLTQEEAEEELGTLLQIHAMDSVENRRSEGERMQREIDKKREALPESSEYKAFTVNINPRLMESLPFAKNAAISGMDRMQLVKTKTAGTVPLIHNADEVKKLGLVKGDKFVRADTGELAVVK